MSLINRWSDSILSPENAPIVVMGDPSDEIWINRAGDEIRVGDMSDDYITNCLNFVRGKDDQWYSIFSAELVKRQNGSGR